MPESHQAISTNKHQGEVTNFSNASRTLHDLSISVTRYTNIVRVPVRCFTVTSTPTCYRLMTSSICAVGAAFTFGENQTCALARLQNWLRPMDLAEKWPGLLWRQQTPPASQPNSRGAAYKTGWEAASGVSRRAALTCCLSCYMWIRYIIIDLALLLITL